MLSFLTIPSAEIVGSSYTVPLLSVVTFEQFPQTNIHSHDPRGRKLLKRQQQHHTNPNTEKFDPEDQCEEEELEKIQIHLKHYSR